MADSSANYSAYGISVQQNQALYNQYLGAYRDVLSGIQSVGGAQRQAITDFYAAKQGEADQSLTTRGLGNTTVQDAVNRGLTLDQAKAQTDLADKIAMTRANYGSQMAQGIHSFLGGYSRGQSQSGGGGGQGFSNGPFDNGGGRVNLGGGGGSGGGAYGWGGFTGSSGGPSSVYVPGGDAGFAGVQGDSGYQFGPSGAVSPGGGDQFGVPSGSPQGYDDSAYAWA